MRLFVTSVLAQEPWKYDSKVVPMPWRQAEADIIKSKLASSGLTLGFYNCDGNVSVSHQRRGISDTLRSSRIRPSFEVSRQSSPR